MLLGVLDEFLELVDHVAVEEPEVRAVDVQRVGAAEAGAGEEGQDGFQGRRVPRGRKASGVFAGSVTRRGATFGWARTRRR